MFELILVIVGAAAVGAIVAHVMGM